MTKEELEIHLAKYDNLFSSENGKYVLEDLKNVFCVYPDALVNTGDKRLDNDIKEGLRIAYNYIINPK